MVQVTTLHDASRCRPAGQTGALESVMSIYRFENDSRGPVLQDQLLRKEKYKASLCRVCEAGFPECLHSPILRGLRVFYFVASTRIARCRPTAVTRVCPALYRLLKRHSRPARGGHRALPSNLPLVSQLTTAS